MKILQVPLTSGSNSAPEPSKPTHEVMVSLLSPVLIAKLGGPVLSGLPPFSFPCLITKWWTGDSCSVELSQPVEDYVLPLCFFFFLNILFMYLRDREQGPQCGAPSQDPGIMTWAEGRCLIDWATQAPLHWASERTVLFLRLCWSQLLCIYGPCTSLAHNRCSHGFLSWN